MPNNNSAPDPAGAGAWGWHRHSEPGGWFSYDRSEAADAIRAALRLGLAVEVWDGRPTTAPSQRFAAGPCCPLSCAIGRPMRGSPPRYQ